MDTERNAFERIGAIVPGYQGYAKREYRRNCDKVLRDHIARDMSRAEKSLNIKINNAIEAGDKDQMRSLEKYRKELNTLNSKIKYAAYGATSFFSNKKIMEEELMNIYQMDMKLADSVKDLVSTVTRLKAEEMGLYINSIESDLDDRNYYIQEFK